MTAGRHPLISAGIGTLAFALGTVAALFTAGPALFSDGQFSERIGVLAVSCAVFAALGLGFGLASPMRWRLSAWCVWAGVVPVVGFFVLGMLNQLPFLALALGFLIGDLAAVLFGAWGGARLRTP
ncbi:MAG: hypothetical protein FDZ75_08970 [Actinobacteria bacterium]|nr:MAG: hypothetical protein FDZ75_08970 [Actinomycetota bacterium]